MLAPGPPPAKSGPAMGPCGSGRTLALALILLKQYFDVTGITVNILYRLQLTSYLRRVAEAAPYGGQEGRCLPFKLWPPAALMAAP